MNYELAKKLKDAGFPDSETWDFRFVSVPTLSELIEACGEKFALLERAMDGLWVADWHDSELDCHTVKGETPEETVANLWLELNKKNEN